MLFKPKRIAKQRISDFFFVLFFVLFFRWERIALKSLVLYSFMKNVFGLCTDNGNIHM